jgi:hypothetical protein
VVEEPRVQQQLDREEMLLVLQLPETFMVEVVAVVAELAQQVQRAVVVTVEIRVEAAAVVVQQRVVLVVPAETAETHMSA